MNKKCFYSSDMFSLGLIIYQMLKDHLGDNKTHLLIKLSNNSINTYKNFMNTFESFLPSKLKFENDDNFLLSKLLQKQYNARPRVREIIDTPWFNDPKLKALNFIMNLESNDQKKNVEFLEKLPKIIGMFEKKIIIKRFLPALLKAIKVETLINPCLPAIFCICESPTFNVDFSREVWTKLKDLFKLRSLPAAAIYFLISKVQYIGEHISQTEFSQNFLNLICKAMDCNVPKIQLVVSNNLKFIANNTDSLSFKNQIFPRIMQVVSSTNSKTLKLSMLKNIKDLYTKLDQNLINDKLLSTLDKVRKADGNNEVCMGICDIYKEISKVVSLEGIANKILPNLITMLVTANITKSNFDKIMELVSSYLDQIKKNRYNELINDGAMLNVDSLANNKENEFNSSAKEKEDDNFMDTLLASSKPITTTSNNTKGSEDFINNLLGNNSFSNFSPSNTNANTNINTISNNINTNNNPKDTFDFVGSNNSNNNNNKQISSNNNNSSNQYDFDFMNNTTNSSKKNNDIFAGVSTNANYNMPVSNSNTNTSNNNNLFNNMNINRNNNNNKEDLLNNLMKDLPSSNTNNNSNNFMNNNSNSFNNSNNINSNFNNAFNNTSNNPFDLLPNNTNNNFNNNNNNNTNQGTGIGNTINFDFNIGGNKNTNTNKTSNNNSNFMDLTGNKNNNNNLNNNFGGMNFGMSNNMNNNSNNLFDFTSGGNTNNNNNNFNNNGGFSFL